MKTLFLMALLLLLLPFAVVGMVARLVVCGLRAGWDGGEDILSYCFEGAPK